MKEYEIKTEQRGMNYYENIQAISVLDAIDRFYSAFGYQNIVQIRLVN